LRDGRVVTVPDAACGYEMARGSSGARQPVALEACGNLVVQRLAVSKIADLLSDMGDFGRVQSPSGDRRVQACGLRASVLARAARLQGFVPLAVSLPMVPAAQVVRA
jgi:hypothetical protein